MKTRAVILIITITRRSQLSRAVYCGDGGRDCWALQWEAERRRLIRLFLSLSFSPARQRARATRSTHCHWRLGFVHSFARSFTCSFVQVEVVR